jgi:hypothetical protein
MSFEIIYLGLKRTRKGRPSTESGYGTYLVSQNTRGLFHIRAACIHLFSSSLCVTFLRNTLDWTFCCSTTARRHSFYPSHYGRFRVLIFLSRGRLIFRRPVC